MIRLLKDQLLSQIPLHQTMEIHLDRKKRVPSHYNPNSYRIFDNHISDDSIGDSMMNKVYLESRKETFAAQRNNELERRNCPQPEYSIFLRHNVREMNKPLCVITPGRTDSEQDHWWLSKITEKQRKVPKYVQDSTQRSDFISHGGVEGNTRHSSNPFIIPAEGIVPTSKPKSKDDHGNDLLEKISYIHNYNCRRNPNEPIRGKLHGSFVWNRLCNDQNAKQVVIETPWTKRDIVKAQKIATQKKITLEERTTKNQNDVKMKEETIPSIPAIEGLPAP